MEEYDWLWCPNEIEFGPSHTVHDPEFGKQPHGYRSPNWVFRLSLPPQDLDNRRKIESFLARTEGTAIVNVYDPRTEMPKHFETSGVVPSLTVTAMDRAARTLTVTGAAGDIITEGDPMSFIVGGVKYYFRAMQDLVLSGAAQSLEVYIRPRLTQTFSVFANRIKPTCRFVIGNINQTGGSTNTDKVSEFELSGVEYWHPVT